MSDLSPSALLAAVALFGGAALDGLTWTAGTDALDGSLDATPDEYAANAIISAGTVGVGMAASYLWRTLLERGLAKALGPAAHVGFMPGPGAGHGQGAGGKFLPDDFIVVRGGTGPIPPPGQLFSGAAGRTLDEAAAGVPYGTIRSTTAGAIRQQGGTVGFHPEPTRRGIMNEAHVNICLGNGPCPFGPQMPNPVPTARRIG